MRLALILFTLVLPLSAQDGAQLYTLYCSACHAPDGKGATGGAFPPLASSPWVAGDPDRSVKVVLHGLHGPVDVLGVTYNLEMPPQGAMLPDDQVAAILTYVRSSWGNSASAVTTDTVKTIRAATADRKTAWTAPEILKLHPLPLEKTALTDLTSQVYKGDWKHLPDFKTLKAENIEEEHDGVISLTDSKHKENFAMVWEGTLNVPADGEYYFTLDCDDAGRLIVDDVVYTEVHGVGPLDGSRVQRCINELKKGPHRFRAEYLDAGGNRGIAIGWRPKSQKNWNWLTDESGPAAQQGESIIIEPTGDRPVIYRNFIEGATSRAIGVGFPGGINLAYSADHLAPALIWTGTFIDGAKKWLARGTDPSSPAGEKIIPLATARTLPAEARFRGYKLDPTGNPTFAIQIGKQILLDSWRAESGTLIRKLTISGAPLEIQIPQPPGITIQRTSEKITLTPTQPVTLTYRWK
jgi:mono/diheme cytochrome c family protein